MDKSEERVFNNKLRRAKERKKHFLVFTLTACLIVLLSLSLNVIFSHAFSPEDREYKYYKSVIIREGDTLWSIAEINKSKSDNNTNLQSYITEVMQMNALQDDRITAGNYLIIPYFDEAIQR